MAHQASVRFPSHLDGREDHTHRGQRSPAQRRQEAAQDFKHPCLENISSLFELKLILSVNKVLIPCPEGITDDRHAQRFESADLAAYESVADCGILVGEVGNAHDQRRSMKS